MSWLKDVDDFVSLCVRERDNWTCWYMGKDNVNCGGEIQCTHLVGRQNRRLRWDMKNLKAGCRNHNYYYSRFNKRRSGGEEKLLELVRIVEPRTHTYIYSLRKDTSILRRQDVLLLLKPIKEAFENSMADRCWRPVDAYSPEEDGLYLTYHSETYYRVTAFRNGCWTDGVKIQSWDFLKRNFGNGIQR